MRAGPISSRWNQKEHVFVNLKKEPNSIRQQFYNHIIQQKKYQF
jgi:hypothetical protein